jgi:hypothetical protein
MDKIMWEINWHSIDNIFDSCTVTPITITREGILPGCSLPSITAKDHKGYSFHGSISDYYPSEKAAWVEVAKFLGEEIQDTVKQIVDLEDDLRQMRDYLGRVRDKLA